MVGQQRGHSPRLSVPSVVLCAMIRKLPPALFSRAKGHSGKGPGVFHLVAAPKVPWSSCLVCTLISQGIAWLLTFIQLSGDPPSFHTVPHSTKQLQGQTTRAALDCTGKKLCALHLLQLKVKVIVFQLFQQNLFFFCNQLCVKEN